MSQFFANSDEGFYESGIMNENYNELSNKTVHILPNRIILTMLNKTFSFNKTLIFYKI